MPNLRRSFLVSLIFTTAASVLGCAADARLGDDEVESDSAAIGDGAPPPHVGVMFGPPALFFEALQAPGLTADQRSKLEAAERAMRPSARPERAAALAAAIRAGSIDPSKLAPSSEEELRMRQDMHTRFADALATAHRVLDTEQRAAVVARVRGRMEHAPELPPPPPGMPGGPAHGPLGFLLADIGLDDAKRTEIESALEATRFEIKLPPPDAKVRAGHRAQMEDLLESFASDDFDAADLPAPPEAPPRPPFFEALEIVVPLLDDSQREALASKIERGPMPPHRRR
ncbi:MAG: hypothetical protein HOV80_27030 [Polyangiaceae bacterium]|nr:hypothetical protein [Polyangiaceae bacterium]